MNNIFIIIPTYNEGPMIGTVVKAAHKHGTVVVVDDGSTDDSGEQARSAGAVVLRHVINRGQGAALQTGTDYALAHGAEVVVHFDADGQMEAGDIARAVELLKKEGVEVVLGSRFLHLANEIPLTKKLIHRAARLFNRTLTGMRLSDVHCGFRALRAHAAAQVRIHHDRMAHATEIEEQIGHLELSYKELPITVHYTEYSQGKAMAFTRHAWQVIKDLIIGKAV